MAQMRPTLLIVDDEPEVLRSLHDLFRLEYRILTFEEGALALEALKQERDVHVILSDQRMPRMSGVEFLQHARRIKPEATRLLLTGYADIKAVIEAINEGGVFRYLTKPWDSDDLISTVRQGVAQHDLIVDKNRLLIELQASNCRLSETNRLKTAFIEVASHELNTPVAVVLGMTEIWKMSQASTATESQKYWVDRVQAAGKRLAGTVERMFKLLNADQFDQAMDLKSLELKPLIEGSIADCEVFLMARGQHVKFDLTPDLGTAEVDAAKFADILTNLVVNAIKFTPDGGTITVSAHPIGGDEIHFQVADQGAGVVPSDRPYLFEPFFTGHDTMHHSSGEFQYGKRGIGLGLCLVKRFVELHGGRVEFDCESGQGSTFGFILPRKSRRRKA